MLYSQYAVTTMLQNIGNSIIRLNGLVVPLHIKFDQFREKVDNDLQMLRDSMDSLNHSISNLSTCLQEHKQQIQTEMVSLKTSLTSTQASIDKLDDSVSNLSMCFQEHKQQTQTKLCKVESSIDKLQKKINESVSNLSMCLQEHKQQTATELSHLQTSLTSTHSKLDTLTNATASDHQQIIDNMTDVECMNTQQNIQLHRNLQHNLTHKLEKIQDDVSYIHGPYTCGGTGEWRRVVYLDMTDPHTTCPSGWQLTGYSKRTCGRVSTGPRTCDSATFPVSGGQYSRVCGRIKAYQYGGPDAFYAYHHRYVTTIDGAYVCGVSVTHGTPRYHIWTFANGAAEDNPTVIWVCPCDASITIRVPPFVGNDYFCESGINGPWAGQRIFRANDLLWDGKDCLPSSTCCSLHNPPYFVKQLPTSTTDDIEARICLYEPSSLDNIAVELVELYVQ